MRPMLTAVVSDLHLGTRGGADVARRPGALDRLAAALAPADRVVVLGDALELREGPLAALLETVRPVFERLAEPLAGKRLTIVPGNHDHALAEPWLARLRLAGEPLRADNEWPVGRDDGPAGLLASWLPDTEVTLAYPGLWLRSGTYATHGHYLDIHLTVPRLESIAASAMARVTGRGADPRTAEDFESVLAPLYGFYAGLAQGASAEVLERGARASRSVWSRVTGDGSVGRFLLGRVTIPAAVAALNRLLGPRSPAGRRRRGGVVGPFSPVLTGAELRRAGLEAMARVAAALAPEAREVVFGHTHRPGPLPGDDAAEWTAPGGARLHNSGSWFLEPAFVSPEAENSPYWPGRVLWVDADGPPRLEGVLGDYAALSA